MRKEAEARSSGWLTFLLIGFCGPLTLPLSHSGLGQAMGMCGAFQVTVILIPSQN